jgi:hypothetical protein
MSSVLFTIWPTLFQKKLLRIQWAEAWIFAVAAVATGWKTFCFGVWLLGVLAYRLFRSSALGFFKGHFCAFTIAGGC